MRRPRAALSRPTGLSSTPGSSRANRARSSDAGTPWRIPAADGGRVARPIRCLRRPTDGGGSAPSASRSGLKCGRLSNPASNRDLHACGARSTPREASPCSTTEHADCRSHRGFESRFGCGRGTLAGAAAGGPVRFTDHRSSPPFGRPRRHGRPSAIMASEMVAFMRSLAVHPPWAVCAGRVPACCAGSGRNSTPPAGFARNKSGTPGEFHLRSTGVMPALATAAGQRLAGRNSNGGPGLHTGTGPAVRGHHEWIPRRGELALGWIRSHLTPPHRKRGAVRAVPDPTNRCGRPGAGDVPAALKGGTRSRPERIAVGGCSPSAATRSSVELAEAPGRPSGRRGPGRRTGGRRAHAGRARRVADAFDHIDVRPAIEAAVRRCPNPITRFSCWSTWKVRVTRRPPRCSAYRWERYAHACTARAATCRRRSSRTPATWGSSATPAPFHPMLSDRERKWIP